MGSSIDESVLLLSEMKLHSCLDESQALRHQRRYKVVLSHSKSFPSFILFQRTNILKLIVV